MSYSSDRGYTGPANVLPPLRCERLEDRSLLSVGGLFVLQGLNEEFVDEMPCEAEYDESIVLEEGIGEVIPVDEEIAWEEVEFTFDDSESWDDTWYYEEDFIDEDWIPEEEYFDDTWYSDEEFLDEGYYEEEYIDESWYDEEEFIDENWIPEEEYWDESWIPEEDYSDDWTQNDDGELVILPVPEEELGDWQERDWTELDPSLGSGDEFDDDLIYAMMASAGGIPVLDLPGLPEISETAVPPLVTPLAAEAPTLGGALPPSGTTNTTHQLPEITAPPSDEDFVGAPSVSELGSDTAEDSSSLRLAIPWESKDHLADPESLELSEDISMD